MKSTLSRRFAVRRISGVLAGLAILQPARALKAAVQKYFRALPAPSSYDPTRHRWQIAIDIDKCIGCGFCAEACKKENDVPQGPAFFRTWVERYIIKKPKPGSGETRGDIVVDSPHGGMDGFPTSAIPRSEILKAFFVPKLCNLCKDSPCSQVCPVGATFDSPDGVVLVDPNYCIGCGFCIQACPYGCRFLNPKTKTAEKCSLCYHRITRGLKPACVEVCPVQARVFGDLLDPSPDDPIRKFSESGRAQSTLKPHLGTGPRVIYAGLDKEVR